MSTYFYIIIMNAHVRYEGRLVMVKKQPFESEEHAKDRAWHVTTAMHCANVKERECRSRMWANEKYYQMKYQSDDARGQP